MDEVSHTNTSDASKPRSTCALIIDGDLIPIPRTLALRVRELADFVANAEAQP